MVGYSKLIFENTVSNYLSYKYFCMYTLQKKKRKTTSKKETQNHIQKKETQNHILVTLGR